jgi:gas vesicle structural protein
VSVVGIELLTIDLRVVIASVDTYLRYAEAVDRLVLHEQNGKGLDDLMDGDDDDDKGQERKRRSGGGRRAVGSGDDSSVKGAVKKVRDRVSGDDDEDEDGVVQKVRKAISGDDDDKDKNDNGSRRRKSS